MWLANDRLTDQSWILPLPGWGRECDPAWTRDEKNGWLDGWMDGTTSVNRTSQYKMFLPRAKSQQTCSTAPLRIVLKTLSGHPGGCAHISPAHATLAHPHYRRRKHHGDPKVAIVQNEVQWSNTSWMHPPCFAPIVSTLVFKGPALLRSDRDSHLVDRQTSQISLLAYKVYPRIR